MMVQKSKTALMLAIGTLLAVLSSSCFFGIPWEEHEGGHYHGGRGEMGEHMHER